ncbi:carbohydrate-binding protein [Demequina globuliformis]|uniref:carbohydrate-binding protein n=1 Tax=Demequina globuliformis TaxID=676202 RepID=UPI000780D578|nr:carbohydrate-binding protein [Demequina globuliformis]
MKLISRSIRLTTAALATAALAAVVAVPAGAAGPEGALNANNLAAGEYTSNFAAGDFTVHAAPGKDVDVDGSDRTSDRGDEYTQRLKLNGSGSAANRSLSFTVDDATQVIVHARSGSGSSDRALGLYDEAWSLLDEAPALADDSGSPITTEVLEVPAAGTYWIASTGSGVNVYHAQIGLDEPQERPAWDTVSAPTVDSLSVNADDPSRIDVTYSGLVGDDGADLAHAALMDASGAVVDRDFTATEGASGSLSLTPPGSGTYTVEVSLTRAGEDAALVSAPAALEDFSLPLAGPSITGSLTTAVSGGTATVTLEWGAVAEAESYSIETARGGDFATVLDGITDTTTAVPGLEPGSTYQMRVVAHRGSDVAVGESTDIDVAASVERWQVADVGSNASSSTGAVDNGDGTVTFDATGSSTKFASSEDGFQYFYTQVDPDTENFTLTATFRVDDASRKDNQSGFGIIAVDDLVAGESSHRYFNSAGALVTRYNEGTDQIVDGSPGARFVTGYTGATNDATAGARDSSGSRDFDPEYRPEITTGPKFGDGDVYEFTLRRSNTGFHAIWHREGSDDIEVIEYDPDMLLAQNPEHFYVGLATARKIAVTVTDWEFTTVHPDNDEEAQERPIEQIPTSLTVDVTRTTAATSLDVPLVADFYGTGQILDADGAVVVDGLELVPGERVSGSVDLVSGDNQFTARAIPAAEQPQLGEYEALESLDPVDVALTITVDAIGYPGQSVWVAPEAAADGAGTQADPVDIYTAVAFAQPGQQVVLTDGTYALNRAVVVERGRDGTENAPITLMSEPGARAVLDLSDSVSGGLHLRADWWHVYNLEITGSGDKLKPMLIQGNHNIVERVESHHNQDTGIQISGSSSEPPALWPSHNLVVSSVAHHNADAGGNDADGFAAKLTVGEGNVFRHNIAHHNIDDGWDLYAKSTTGPIGTVVIEDSVAYNNGWLSDDPSRTGEGNGFKLGGESMPGDHLLRNSVSYGNLGTGVTSNSGPDVRLDRVTSVDNDRGVRLETNASATDYVAGGVLSWRNPSADVLGLKQDDESLIAAQDNYFDGATANASDGRPAEVTADWFILDDPSGVTPEIASDGSVDMSGLFALTDVAPEDTGARLTVGDGSTDIEVLPEVQGPSAWFATTVYTAGDRVQHEGYEYEARWWTRNNEPGAHAWGPWVKVGEVHAPAAVAECAVAWDPSHVYTGGELVSVDGVNYRAQWWTRAQEPGGSVWGPWAAVGTCAA